MLPSQSAVAREVGGIGSLRCGRLAMARLRAAVSECGRGGFQQRGRREWRESESHTLGVIVRFPETFASFIETIRIGGSGFRLGGFGQRFGRGSELPRYIRFIHHRFISTQCAFRLSRAPETLGSLANCGGYTMASHSSEPLPGGGQRNRADDERSARGGRESDYQAADDTECPSRTVHHSSFQFTDRSSDRRYSIVQYARAARQHSARAKVNILLSAAPLGDDAI